MAHSFTVAFPTWAAFSFFQNVFLPICFLLFGNVLPGSATNISNRSNFNRFVRSFQITGNEWVLKFRAFRLALNGFFSFASLLLHQLVHLTEGCLQMQWSAIMPLSVYFLGSEIDISVDIGRFPSKTAFTLYFSLWYIPHIPRVACPLESIPSSCSRKPYLWRVMRDLLLLPSTTCHFRQLSRWSCFCELAVSWIWWWSWN